MPDPTPFIEFAKEPDAIILLKSLAAGMGLNTETRKDIGNFFKRKLEDERSHFDPREEREFFGSGGPFGEGSEDNRKAINVGQVGRAFGITAAALAGRAAVNKAREQGIIGPSVVSQTKTLIGKQAEESRFLQNTRNELIDRKRALFSEKLPNSQQLADEIKNLQTQINGLQGDLDSEFLKPAERNITRHAIDRKTARLNATEFVKGPVDDLANQRLQRKAITSNKVFNLEERLRIRVVDALDSISGFGTKSRPVIESFVDNVISRGKATARVAGRVAGPAAIVFAAREFQDEMKMLLEQKKRALSDLEPAGVSGDSLGP